MKFNILIIGQSGRLQYAAILFLASLRQSAPDFNGQVFVAEPQHNERWDQNPAMTDPEIREIIENLGGKITPFENTHFGGYYPYGNKIEALSVLPEGEPFVFFDTDTLITGALDRVPFDFERPSASLKVEGTWPVIELYGPGYTATWKSLYDKFKLDFESSLDVSQPDEYWRRYLYFNAGYFYYKCPKIFGDRFLNYALAIRDDGPTELVCQELDPWLDQVALPLVIHSFGGGRDTLEAGHLDGTVSCHYRLLPLLYARESDLAIKTLETAIAPNKIKKVVKAYEPIRRMVYQKRGAKVRALFDQNNLPRKEKQIRNTIKRTGFWMR
ncbi:hypothetical protein OAR42_02445 [Planktomarina temperata]|nr:hypothetical protein [Planktomarina temperata]